MRKMHFVVNAECFENHVYVRTIEKTVQKIAGFLIIHIAENKRTIIFATPLKERASVKTNQWSGSSVG